MTKKISIEAVDNSPFYFGQKIYVVDSVGGEKFETTCPICDGTKEITYRGVEFPCSHCSSGSNKTAGNTLYLTQYKVFEYVVNEFVAKGEETKTRYNKGSYPKISVQWKAFNKSGRFIDGTDNISCFEEQVCKEGERGWKFNPEVPAWQKPLTITKKIHLTKKGAEQMVRELNNKQKEMLADFNKKNGTKFEFSWK